MGTDPHQVMGWKRFTDNRMSVFGSFMVAFCWPVLVFGTPAFHLRDYEIPGRMFPGKSGNLKSSSTAETGRAAEERQGCRSLD